MAANDGWWAALADSAPAWGAAGIALTQLVNVVVAKWSARQAARAKEIDAGAEGFRLAQGNQQAVVQQLFELVKTLRQDVADLRRELEDSEAERLKAEDRVRLLRDEVHGLRNELARIGAAGRRPRTPTEPEAETT